MVKELVSIRQIERLKMQLRQLIPYRLRHVSRLHSQSDKIKSLQEDLDEAKRDLAAARNRLATVLFGKTDYASCLRYAPFKLDSKQTRIRALFNIHESKPCVIIGNGPSVIPHDLDRFANLVTFGCNKLYLAYDQFKLRPTYTVSSDKQVLEDFGIEIAQKSDSVPIFIASNEWNLQFPSNVINVDRIVYQRKRELFHETPIWGLPDIGSVVVVALQLAYYMGCDPVYIYGIDHSFHVNIRDKADDPWRAADNDGNHFIPGYREGRPWAPPNVSLIEDGFALCNEFYSQNGRKLFNISRKSKLKAIPLRAFESIF